MWPASLHGDGCPPAPATLTCILIPLSQQKPPQERDPGIEDDMHGNARDQVQKPSLAFEHLQKLSLIQQR